MKRILTFRRTRPHNRDQVASIASEEWKRGRALAEAYAGEERFVEERARFGRQAPRS
jgi:hypothetical protein